MFHADRSIVSLKCFYPERAAFIIMLKKKILYVTEFAGFAGGIEHYVFQTASLLRRSGFSVSLLYHRTAREPERFLSVFDASFHGAIPDETFDLVILHKIRNARFLKALHARFGEQLLFLAHDHEHYCPRNYYYTPFGRTNCSRAYSFLRCSLCGSMVSPKQHKNGFFPAMRSKWLDFPNCLNELRTLSSVVVLSAFMRDNLIRNGFDPTRIHILHPPVPVRRNSYLPHDPPILTFIGQLIQGKGADSFLNMLPLLKSPWRAVVAGDGNERENLKMLAEKLHLSVEFRGFVAETESVYRESDLVILPFRWQEPFGLVGAEAAAHGIPVVAFDIGGVREWLADGQTGFAVPSGNLNSLAAAVDSLLSDPALRCSMSEKAFDFAENMFSETAFIQSFQLLLQKGK